MLMNARTACALMTPPPHRSQPSGTTCEEHQPELADLHLVAALQRGLLDALPVDVGAVEAAHVTHGELAAAPVELHVPPGHGHIVQENVAFRVATRRSEVAVEQKSAPRVRAT